MKDQISLAQQQTEAIIEELLEDGSDPDALYLIEHHIFSTDFDALENFAIEAFKLGYEATDPEDSVDDNGDPVICCDIVSEIPLDVETINNQIAQLIKLTSEFDVHYDGWGTYFEGDDEDDEDYEEEDERDDEEEDDTYH